MACLRRTSGVTLIEMVVAILIMAVISGAIAGSFYVARNYYFYENQRVQNQQGASLFLLAVEKIIRKASIAVVYDDFTNLNQVSSGTCLKIVDYNGTPTDFSDDTTHFFYLSGSNVYWQVISAPPKLLARNVGFLLFTQDSIYIQTFFQVLGNPVLSYQTGAKLRN